MHWDQAATWVDQLVYGGGSNWRMPTALNDSGNPPPLMILIFGTTVIPVHTSPIPPTISNCDLSAEGWNVQEDDLIEAPTWFGEGGNPGGRIQWLDAGDGVAYFLAPWTGNFSGYIGGTLQYDINLLWDAAGYTSHWEVIVESGTQEIYYHEHHHPLKWTWTTYEIPLTADQFKTDVGTFVDETVFQNIMSSVTALKIRADYSFYVSSEIVGLDNVKLTAIPAPSALWLLGSGLIGIIGVRRKLKS